jgi:hypothetical protein
MLVNPVGATQVQDDDWNRFVEECKKIVTDIQMGIGSALIRCHDLGTIILAAGIRGKQIDALAAELRNVGRGFSRSNLYYCMKFARRFSDFGAFMVLHGDQLPWNRVIDLLADHPRSKSNALDSQTGKQQSATNMTAPVRKVIKVEQKTMKWYEYERNRGFKGDLSAFLNACVIECYEPNFVVDKDGKIVCRVVCEPKYG